MVVIVLDLAPEKLRGMLTRWMMETKPGVFVGKLNSMVRDKVWQMIQDFSIKGALMIYAAPNEQGFQIAMHGEPQRSVVDLDGLQFIKIR